MGIAKIKKGGSGSKIINGIVEEYLASSEDIRANTFVEFVNNTSFTVNSSKYCSAAYYAEQLRAIKLTDTTALVVYNVPGSYAEIYAQVITISGNTVTYGTQLVVKSYSSSEGRYYVGTNFTIARLSDASALLIYTCSTSSSTDYYHIQATVLTVSGTTITAGTAKSLTTTNYIGSHLDSVALANSKVMMLYGTTSGAQYANVLTVSGNSITLASDLSIVSSVADSYSGDRDLRGTLMESGKVFVVYYTSTSVAYGVVLTVNGTTVTKGTAVQLLSDSESIYGGRELIEISENRMLLIYCAKSSSYEVHGVIATINGNVITIETSAFIIASSVYSYSFYLSACKIADNVIVLQYYGRILKLLEITDSVRELGSATMSASVGNEITTMRNHNTFLMSDGVVLNIVANNDYSKDYYNYYSAVVNAQIEMLIKQSVNTIDGLTKTTATTTKPGKVWTLA